MWANPLITASGKVLQKFGEKFMKWFQTFLQKLRQIFATEKKPTASRISSAVEQQRLDTPQLAVRTDTFKFEDLDHLVQPLLQQMAQDRWGSGFSYEAHKNRPFRWQIWNSNIVKQTSEYWMVEFIPELGQFKIYANGKNLKSEVSMDDLRTQAAQAVKLGPIPGTIPRGSIDKDIFRDDVR